MANIRSFKELRVWQNSIELALIFFRLTRRFPAEERYSLTDQFRRSSRSIGANIAESWRKRRYPAAFISKLSDADGEAAETQSWTELSLRMGYLVKSEAIDLDERCEQIMQQIITMIDRPGAWLIRPHAIEPVGTAPKRRLIPAFSRQSSQSAQTDAGKRSLKLKAPPVPLPRVSPSHAG